MQLPRPSLALACTSISVAIALACPTATAGLSRPARQAHRLWVAGVSADVTALVTVASGDLPRASLEVDATALAEDAAGVAKRIDERCKSVLLGSEILPGRSADDPTIRVRVTESGGDDDPAYHIEMQVIHAGAPIEEDDQIFDCPLCTEGELIAAIESRLPRTIEGIRALAEATEPKSPQNPAPLFFPKSGPVSGHGTDPEPHPDADHVTPEHPIATPTPSPAGRPREGPSALGYTGIILNVIGLTALGVGIGLAAKRDKFQPGNGTNGPQVTSTKPTGYTLIGVGAAALITGTIFIILDRKHAKTRNHTFVPHAGPHHAGFGFHTQF